MAEIARRADVGRPTVYAHFPDERSLFRACAGHWSQANPRPDPAAWARIADAELRLRKALDQLYAWYQDGEQMLANIARDAALMPAVAEVTGEFRTPYPVELMVALVRLGREPVKVPREERRLANVAGTGKLGRPAS